MQYREPEPRQSTLGEVLPVSSPSASGPLPSFAAEMPSYEETTAESYAWELLDQGYSGPALVVRLRNRLDAERIRLDDAAFYRLCGTICHDPLLEALGTKQFDHFLLAIADLARYKREAPSQFAILLTEIRRVFGRHEGLRDLLTAINAEARQQEGQRPDVATIAHTWVMEYRREWAYDEEAECWRSWTGSHWQYEREKNSTLDAYAMAALQAASIQVNSVGVLNCFNRIAAAKAHRTFRPAQHAVNFDSGVLDCASREHPRLLSHSHEQDFLSVLPYTYDPYGQHKRIDAFLSRLIPDEHGRQALMGHLGLALMGDKSFHKYLKVKGKPGGGKSTLLALCNAVAGADDYYSFAGKSLFSADLEGKRARARWKHHPLVCVDELPASALQGENEEIFKGMTAHGGSETRDIHKSEETKNRWGPKLILASNETDHFKDTSGAILKRRAILIETDDKPIPEQEQVQNLLEEYLTPELPAFAATCIAYGLAIRMRGYYPQSAGMRAHLAKVASLGNPLKQFIEDECLLSPEAVTPVATLHEHYKQALEGDGNKPCAKNTLSMMLTDMGIGITQCRKRVGGGRQVRAFSGIRLKTEEEKEREPEKDDLEGFTSDPLLFDGGVSTIFALRDGVKMIVSEPYSPLDPPEKPGPEPLSTMSTINFQNIPHKDDQRDEDEGKATIQVLEEISPTGQEALTFLPIGESESDLSYSSYSPELGEPGKPNTGEYKPEYDGRDNRHTGGDRTHP